MMFLVVFIYIFLFKFILLYEIESADTSTKIFTMLINNKNIINLQNTLINFSLLCCNTPRFSHPWPSFRGRAIKSSLSRRLRRPVVNPALVGEPGFSKAPPKAN